MKLTYEVCMNALNKLKMCDYSRYVRIEVYGLHEEDKSLKYWIDKFRDDASVMLLDIKSGKIYYKGEIFDKECRVIV